jgi:hypothetical protein
LGGLVDQLENISAPTKGSSSVEALSAALGGWVELWGNSTEAVPQESNGSPERDVQNQLLRILSSETLMILAGLGTSLGIPEVQGVHAPNMNDLWERAELLPEFASVQSIVRPELVQERNIEHLLSEVQARLILEPGNADLRSFLSSAEQSILEACSFVGPDSQLNTHQLFLRKVARRSLRLLRTQLFTTNYDLAFESAAARSRFNVIDGFGLTSEAYFDGGSFDLDFVRRNGTDQMVLEPNVLQLLKLHGSIDWSRDGQTVRKVSAQPSHPVLIYPSANKFQLSFQQPYLEMMSRFQLGLRRSDVSLMVVGFGFNDAHIVAPIEAAIRSNVGMRILVVDPGIRRSNRNPHFDWMEQLVLDGDQRITLVRGTFSDLTRILPDVAEYDERQSHSDRLARITRDPSQ